MSRQKEIYQELQSLSDPKYKEFHGGLVPGEENLLGVRIPALRRYARELFTKSGGRADILLQEIGDSCYEEITLQGMIIGLQRNVPSEMLFAQIKLEFDVRFGVVMLLDHYMKREYLDRLFATAQSVHHEGYYVKMAVAWLISICFVKFYDETMAFMKQAKLDDFTYNKALQKARESRQISNVQKAQLQAMKRR